MSPGTIRCPAGLCWDPTTQACVTACRGSTQCCAVTVNCPNQMDGRTCSSNCPAGLDPLFKAQGNYAAYVYPTCDATSGAGGGKAG